MMWQRRQLCTCMLVLLVLTPKYSRLCLELTFGSLACVGNQSCARDLPGGPHDGPAVCLQISWQAQAWCGGTMDPIMTSWNGESCGKEQGYTAGEDSFLRRTWIHGDEGSARFS